jgi:2-polyprenyl-6-methoxyphenol hydroxylase-like FAD-dependent oxidoreductase
MSQTQVLIAGAGPTGLVLALWLTKLGVRVRIVDKTAEPGTTSRALAVHARTLELYRQLDLTQTVIDRGYKVPGVQLWVKGEPKAHLDFTKLDSPLSPYAFLEIFPQDEHERLLISRLEALGVSVERRTELTGFTDVDGRITARLRDPDGAETTCEADYVAGCDGARSVVRHVIGASYPGGTYQQLFYVADVEAGGPPMDGLLNVDMDQADFLAIFPLAAHDRARLIGTVREDRVGDPEKLKFEDVSSLAIQHLKVQVRTVNWFSTYRVHHRVTDHFRVGRAFLVGDAAHIHSPAGGQGMNTGIGDAINLAWKLAWVLDGRAPDRLLDSYEAERIDFARRLVATTDRVFSLASAEGALADFMRTGVFPTLMPAALSFEAAREYIFRTVSQITLNYRDGPISHGHAGKVRGGDRLPWASANGVDNFAPLTAMTWQVHVYGEARPELRDWCDAQSVPLHLFAWDEAYARAGLARDAAYVLRPDTYVALAEPGGALRALERYFADQQIRPA